MKFFKDDNNNYQIEKDDYLLLTKKQILYYSKLNPDLFDKSTNVEILKELIKDIDYELENSSFPEREVYISEKNYMERNKRAVIFYQLYVSYGIALMKSYIDYFKRNPGQFFNIEDDNQNIMKLDRRIDEIENDFRKHLEQNLNSNEHPVYGTTMLTIS